MKTKRGHRNVSASGHFKIARRVAMMRKRDATRSTQAWKAGPR